MPKFREKVRKVEAYRFVGNDRNKLDIVAWIKENGYSWFDMFTPAPTKGVSIDRGTGFLMLVDEDGKMSAAETGDWLVLDLRGRIYPVKHKDFLALYEEVSLDEDEGDPDVPAETVPEAPAPPVTPVDPAPVEHVPATPAVPATPSNNQDKVEKEKPHGNAP